MNDDNQEVNHATTNREGDTIVYNVPVQRKVWDKPTEPQSPLKERILNAKSQAEVEALLEKGVNTYKNVSTGTITKWKKAARKRIDELSNPPKTEPVKKYSKKY